MKRILLTCAVCLSLAACGSSSEDEPVVNPDPRTGTTETREEKIEREFNLPPSIFYFISSNKIR